MSWAVESWNLTCVPGRDDDVDNVAFIHPSFTHGMNEDLLVQDSTLIKTVITTTTILITLYFLICWIQKVIITPIQKRKAILKKFKKSSQIQKPLERGIQLHAIIHDLSKSDDMDVKEVKETLKQFSFTSSLDNQISILRETFDRLNCVYVPTIGRHHNQFGLRLMNESQKKQLQSQVHVNFFHYWDRRDLVTNIIDSAIWEDRCHVVHLAAKYGLPWGCDENPGLNYLAKQYCNELSKKDKFSGLYPFMLAAAASNPQLESVYQLMRLSPIHCG